MAKNQVKFVSQLKPYIEALKKEYHSRLTKFSQDLVKHAKQQSSGGRSKPGGWPGKASGTLANSYSATVVDQNGRLTVRLVNSSKVAALMLTGSSGGSTVRPKRAKALTWFSKSGSKVYATSVVRGYMAPRSWNVLAFEEKKSRFAELITKPIRVSI